jgi:predicted amidohydrolase
MKIALVQIQPRPGEIPANTESHRQWIEKAAALGAEWVFFPELSLTGYEPTLAEELAMSLHDTRLAIFQVLADRLNLNIGIGVPIRQEGRVRIGTVLFGPAQPRRLYTKHYLHPDEEPYFTPGDNASLLIGPGLALAICYELSVLEHAAKAADAGAGIYLASVAKSAAGMQQAKERMSEIARSYAMVTLLVNSVGPADDFVGAGRSFVLDSQGKPLGELGKEEENLLFFDTATQEVSTAS